MKNQIIDDIESYYFFGKFGFFLVENTNDLYVYYIVCELNAHKTDNNKIKKIQIRSERSFATNAIRSK